MGQFLQSRGESYRAPRFSKRMARLVGAPTYPKLEGVRPSHRVPLVTYGYVRRNPFESFLPPLTSSGEAFRG